MPQQCDAARPSRPPLRRNAPTPEPSRFGSRRSVLVLQCATDGPSNRCECAPPGLKLFQFPDFDRSIPHVPRYGLLIVHDARTRRKEPIWTRTISVEIALQGIAKLVPTLTHHTLRRCTPGLVFDQDAHCSTGFDGRSRRIRPSHMRERNACPKLLSHRPVYNLRRLRGMPRPEYGQCEDGRAT